MPITRGEAPRGGSSAEGAAVGEPHCWQARRALEQKGCGRLPGALHLRELVCAEGGAQSRSPVLHLALRDVKSH